MEFEYIVIVLLIWLALKNYVDMKSLEKRLKNMEFMLNKLSNQVGVPEHPINDKLRQLLKDGQEVKAIKETREYFGYSLLEAKRYVDELK